MRIKERRKEPYIVKMGVMMALALVRQREQRKLRGRVGALLMKRL